MLVKWPLPLPSLVLLIELIVELLSVLQQTPREVTSAPPLFVTFPPDFALV